MTFKEQLIESKAEFSKTQICISKLENQLKLLEQQIDAKVASDELRRAGFSEKMA